MDAVESDRQLPIGQQFERRVFVLGRAVHCERSPTSGVRHAVHLASRSDADVEVIEIKCVKVHRAEAWQAQLAPASVGL